MACQKLREKEENGLTSGHMETPTLSDQKLVRSCDPNEDLPCMHKNMQTRFATITWFLESSNREVHDAAAKIRHRQ